MSLHLPARRLVRSTAALANLEPSYALSLVLPLTQRRTFLNNLGRIKDWLRKPDPKLRPKNPLTEEYLKKKPTQPKLVRGGLADSSILEDEDVAGPKVEGKGIIDNSRSTARNPVSMAAALDPDPSSRKRWERKMVIREIHKRGRLTKAQYLKRQERELLSKSHDLGSTTKKLALLANQIKGKTVDAAIIQMRFSKKKVAKDVKEHLEHARNEAIVKRGMGLGLTEGEGFTPITVMTNDKKRVKVQDPTTIYVDEAWVGKGLYQETPDFRARGQISMMKNRTTSISVVLKEHKTLIRLDDERKKKLERRKVWTQLPNRPITAQRQYYSW